MSFLFRRGGNRVTVDEAHRRTRGDDTPAVLLDVREQAEWNTGHAPDAVHVPLSRLTTGAALPVVLRDRPLVVICRSGNRSRQALHPLTEPGAKAVDVRGGMSAWATAGYPVIDELGNSGSVA